MFFEKNGLRKNKNQAYTTVLSWAPFGFTVLCELDDIIDPEFPFSLTELNILKLESIEIIIRTSSSLLIYLIPFYPTYGQCKLAPLIGIVTITSIFRFLSLIKLARSNNDKWLVNFKVNLSSDDHKIGENITKQINDKERLSAALENRSIRLSILKCIKK